MIRLAVLGADDSRRHVVGARLRGASLEVDGGPTCNGAVFLGPPFDDVERWLQSSKPMLVATDLPLATLRNLCGVDSRASLVLANPDRYLPSRLLIKQHLDAGKLGTPGLIRIHRWQAAVEPGLLLRDLDLIRWYFQADAQVVYAVNHARGMQVHVGLPSGGMATIDHAAVPAVDPYYSLTLIGASGTAYADDHQNVQLAYQGGRPRAIRAEEGVGRSVAMLQDFVDAIATGRVESLDRPDFPAVLRVVDAIEQSVRTKQAVVLAGGQ